jgi:hypothetical protein
MQYAKRVRFMREIVLTAVYGIPCSPSCGDSRRDKR